MKATARSYAGQAKKAARHGCVTPGKVYRNALLLPGEGLRDFTHFRETGNFTDTTHIVVVERDPKIMAKIARKLAAHPNPAVFCPGELESTPDHGPYDLLNLDTCSALSPKILDWLGKQKLLPGAEVNLWLADYRGGSWFARELYDRYFFGEGLKVVHQLYSKCHDYQNRSADEIAAAAAIYSTLKNYDCDVQPLRKYSEHQGSMRVFRFTNCRHRPQPRHAATTHATPYKLHARPARLVESKNLSKDTATALCLRHNEGPGVKAYATKQLRKKIRDGVMAGKQARRIKAALKARVSRLASGQRRKNTHDFIDNL